MAKFNEKKEVKEKKVYELPSFFASCPKGCEELLLKEIENQGITGGMIKPGGVFFQCPTTEALKVILYSRIASRVFHELQVYTIKNQNDLYDLAKEKWWEKIFRLNQTFMIKTLFDDEAKFQFKNSLIFSQKLKDAIADYFRNKFQERPSVDTINPDISFLLRLEKKASKTKELQFNAIIYVDMCGDPLSNRGYRDVGYTAPLRENLGAALIMSSDFDPEKDIFIDSMCGSGTLLIEAILIKAKVAPTYLRVRPFIEKKVKTFHCQNHLWFTNDKGAERVFSELMEKVYSESNDRIMKLQTGQFLGFDLAQGALDISRSNFQSARIPLEIINLNKRDATKIRAIEEPPGIIFCNPPYGERMGDEEKLKGLYHEYGENLKHNFKGYRAYIFTSKPELRKSIGLKTKERHKFYNGNIECRLLKYELF